MKKAYSKNDILMCRRALKKELLQIKESVEDNVLTDKIINEYVYGYTDEVMARDFMPYQTPKELAQMMTM